MTIVQKLGSTEIHVLQSATARVSEYREHSFVTCVCGKEFTYPGEVALYQPTHGVRPTCEGCRAVV